MAARTPPQGRARDTAPRRAHETAARHGALTDASETPAGPLRQGAYLPIFSDVTLAPARKKKGPREGEGATPRDFYKRAARVLLDAEVDFLVGGAFALAHYTDVARDTKDLDLFVRPEDAERALAALADAGYETETPFPHWLGKAHHEGHFVDVIFSSGNGVAMVDDLWFEHAQRGRVFELDVLICPAEEILWSKAFILERERFDGADVNHLLRDRGAKLDWERLLLRFGEHWRVLLGHLVFFGYVYPGERHRVPGWVMDELLDRLAEEGRKAPPRGRVCQGTLLSREQYLLDVEHLGYKDARITRPEVHMTKRDVITWTNAIPNRRRTRAKVDRQRRRSG
jgi:hypothetical protein